MPIALCCSEAEPPLTPHPQLPHLRGDAARPGRRPAAQTRQAGQAGAQQLALAERHSCHVAVHPPCH